MRSTGTLRGSDETGATPVGDGHPSALGGSSEQVIFGGRESDRPVDGAGVVAWGAAGARTHGQDYTGSGKSLTDQVSAITISGMTTGTLTGIRKASGVCADCARELAVQVFTVLDNNGAERDLGRRCAARATGFTSNTLDREVQRIARIAVVSARRDALLAAGVTTSLAGIYSATDAWWTDRDAADVAAIIRNAA